MSDFEPTTDFPESVDQDDTIVERSTTSGDRAVQAKRTRILQAITGAATLVLIAFGFPWLRAVVALAAFYVLMKAGMAVAGALARPIPEAPPSGELRKVKLTYRCDVCGTELKMTRANDQVPEAPRHCTEDMVLTTNLDDIF